MLRLFPFLLLAACTEVVDQGAHLGVGYGMARDVSRWADESATRDLITAYAYGREAAQIDAPNPYCTMEGKPFPAWGPGKHRDIAWWLRGVELGLKERN